jgi:hypothetical protein
MTSPTRHASHTLAPASTTTTTAIWARNREMAGSGDRFAPIIAAIVWGGLLESQTGLTTNRR